MSDKTDFHDANDRPEGLSDAPRKEWLKIGEAEALERPIDRLKPK